ncbi:MAG: hypothetical protein WCP30_19060, partial [Mycobacteriaceae bacterium]
MQLSAESMDLFVGSEDAPQQVVRVSVAGGSAATVVRISGDGLDGSARAEAGDSVIEVPVAVERPVPGARRAAVVSAGDTEFAFEFTVAEPGWTMYMI